MSRRASRSASAASAKDLVFCWPEEPILPKRTVCAGPLTVISQNLFEVPLLNSKYRFQGVPVEIGERGVLSLKDAETNAGNGESGFSTGRFGSITFSAGFGGIESSGSRDSRPLADSDAAISSSFSPVVSCSINRISEFKTAERL